MKNRIYILVVLFVWLFPACIPGGASPVVPTPSAPPVYSLPPPIFLSSPTMLPAEPPPAALSCALEDGRTVKGGSYLSPDLEALLGGELERLAGLPAAYQKAERSAALIPLDKANEDAKKSAADLYRAELSAYRWRKGAGALFLLGAAGGVALGAFLVSGP